MAVLEEVSEMQNQGVPEADIVKKLQDQGVAPKSINDALNQTKIKQAVNNEGGEDYNEFSPLQGQSPQTSQVNARAQELPDNDYEEEEYAPPPVEDYAPQQQEYVPQSQDEYSPYQDGEAYSPGLDTSTIIEISEQVFFEKIEKIQKQIDQFAEFMTLEKSRIEDISNRLNRMEMMADKLQITILEKVGSYGNNLENIKKEMSMMQDSFGKMVNPIVKASQKNTTTKTSVRKNTKK